MPVDVLSSSDTHTCEPHSHWMISKSLGLRHATHGQGRLGPKEAHLATGHVQGLLHEPAQLHCTTGMVRTSARNCVCLCFMLTLGQSWAPEHTTKHMPPMRHLGALNKGSYADSSFVRSSLIMRAP